MKKRQYECLEEENRPINRAMEFTDARGRALAQQNQIADLLEKQYGFDIADRFLTADDEDSQHPSVLMPTKEDAGRIKRLRGIIREIRSGKIRRKVEKPTKPERELHVALHPENRALRSALVFCYVRFPSGDEPQSNHGVATHGSSDGLGSIIAPWCSAR